MIIAGGSASQLLSKRLAEELGYKLAKAEQKRFPDRECYVRILDDLKGEDVVLVQTAYPDDNVVELFLWQDAIREFEIRRLTTVIPYYGYSRQDKKFLDGEPVSARVLARLFELHTDELVTVDLHAEGIIDYFDKPVRHVSGLPLIIEYLKDKIDVIILPDKGAHQRAKGLFSGIDMEWDYLEKKRIDGEHVEIAPKSVNVGGKKVALVDDIISTGGTMMRAAEQLKAQGAVSLTAACTHGLFAKGALPKLRGAFDEVISSDTIENETSMVSVASEIAKVFSQS